MSPDKYKKKSDWELESAFDRATTLEELIASPPFKEASDSLSGSHVAGARIPSWLNRRIAYLAEMKATSYQIHSDVIRDAIHIGLRVLMMRYKASPEWDVEARMAKAVDKVGTVRRIRNQVKDLSQGLEEMVTNKDIKQAVEGLEDFVVPVLELEDEWYKQKIIQMLMDTKVARDLLSKCGDSTQRMVMKIYKETEEQK